MKRLLTVIGLGVMLSSFAVLSGLDEVVSAMKSGNTNQITKYFDNTVEITTPGSSNSYSKDQAERVLIDFFSTNSVKSFEVVHKGENSGSQYCIGTLSTKGGSYRTTIFMKQKGNQQLLQELRFESM
ncbi:MAG TPA: DUF4783 domain-containing protein [Ferruginibacter sp.]|nr:DUF4783 domain-containing protein [Ferruginibacter sp.]